MENNIDPFNAPQLPGTFRTGFTQGLLCALVLIILSIVSNLLGAEPGSNAGGMLPWISVVISIGWTLYAIRQYKFNEANQEITFGKAYSIAAWMVLIIAVAMGIYTYFFFDQNPDLVEKAKEMAIEKIDSNPDISDADKEKTIDAILPFMTPAIYAVSTLFFNAVTGLVTGLLAAGLHRLLFPFKDASQA